MLHVHAQVRFMLTSINRAEVALWDLSNCAAPRYIVSYLIEPQFGLESLARMK